MVDNALGDTPQQEASDRSPPPAPHDDEPGFQLLTEVQDGLDRRAVQQAGLRGDAQRLDLTHSFLEEPARLPIVEVRVVGPHYRGVAEASRGRWPRVREYEARRALERLTDREKEVLSLMAEGLDAGEIASRLYISAKTERNHAASILSKLGVHSRLQAVIFAARHGAVEVGRGHNGADGSRTLRPRRTQ